MDRRVVITGLGAIAPRANNVNELWDNLLNGKNGISLISKCSLENLSVKVGGEIEEDLDTSSLENTRFLRKCDNFSKYAAIAASEAIDDSRMEINNVDKRKMGIFIGNNSGGWFNAEKGLKDLYSNGSGGISPYLASNWFPAAPQGVLSILFGIKGYSKTIAADMASSNVAIGQAFNCIKSGKIDFALAGGTESLINNWGLLFYNSSGILSQKADIEKAFLPYSSKRSGLVPADGAACLILETYESAIKRGATIYAEISNCAQTNDGYDYINSNCDGHEYSRCIEIVLHNKTRQPDYISLNGTGIKNEEDSEVNGLKKYFSSKINNSNISCPKAFYGNTFGAAAAMDVIIACLSMKNNIIIKMGNVEELDPVYEELDFVIGKNKTKEINSSLVLSKGLGGFNSAISLSRI